MIHIFKREFPQQVRGIPPLNSSLDALKCLEDYKIAEILAAKVSSCLGIFYERNNINPAGDFLDTQETDDKGVFAEKLEPFMASVAPAGYSVKTLAPNHPNNGYGEFTKSILKQIASSLGVSYSKLIKDYSDVNYSSLREATLDETAFYAEQQQSLIDCWKDIQFRMFIESLAVNTDIIKPSQVKDILRQHTWVCYKRAWVDPGKEIVATERELKLGLKSPLMIMEENGLDPDEVMKSWTLYNEMCDKYKLAFPVTENPEEQDGKLVTEDQDYNNETTQTEALEAER